MTLLAALSILLVPAAATRTAGAASPTQRDWHSAYRYWHGAAVRQRARADDLQRRLTRRVLQVRSLQGRVRGLQRALRQKPQGVSYAIHLAATVYGVSEYEMHRVASCESGHFAGAVNGQYRGVFQEGPMFERGPFGRAGFSVWDPIANSLTAAETVSREGWSQWSCKP